MKAELIFKRKLIQEDGSIIEAVIWQLPNKSNERSHSLKYRLYYGDMNGNCIVRYDNERGKGDHKHIENVEMPYAFTTIEKLYRDFINDISAYRDGGKENE